MAEKQYTEVTIDGRTITMGGTEDVVYMQRIAAYVDDKIAECRSSAGYNRQTPEDKRTMLLLNIADDYFRAKTKAEELESRVEELEEDLDKLRHELVHQRIRKEGKK